jgi:hypothetical protein
MGLSVGWEWVWVSVVNDREFNNTVKGDKHRSAAVGQLKFHKCKGRGLTVSLVHEWKELVRVND